MAYIGQPPYDAPYPAGDLVVDTFSGNNSTTAFTLSKAPLSENNTFVFISGVYQDKDQYSISGVTVTFTAAPPTGTNNIQVIQGQPTIVNTPGSNTVGWSSLATDIQASQSGLIDMLHIDSDTAHRDMIADGWLPAFFNQQWGGAPHYFELLDGATDTVYKFEAATGFITSGIGGYATVAAASGNTWNSQGFKISQTGAYGSIWLKMYKVGNPTNSIQMYILPDDGTGKPSGSTPVTNGTATTISGKLFSSDTNGQWIRFTFATPPSLTANTQYHIAIKSTGAVDATNYWAWTGAYGTSQTYPHGQNCQGDATPTWTGYGNDNSFIVEAPSSLASIQTGGIFSDGKLTFFEGSPLNQSNGRCKDLKNFCGLDLTDCTLLVRGTAWTKDKTIMDITYGLDHDRIVLRANASTGYPQVDVYESDGTKHTVTGTTDVSSGNHDIAIRLRAKNDGSDVVQLWVNGASQGTPVSSASIAFDTLFGLAQIGTAWIGGGFALAPTWSGSSISSFTGLPSTLGWTYTGTATEGNAFSVSGGKLYQNKNGYTSTQDGYYVKSTAGLSNTNGYNFISKQRVVSATNTKGEAGIDFIIFDGTKSNNCRFGEYFFGNESFSASPYVQGDMKTTENVINLMGKGSDSFTFINGKLFLDGSSLMTATTSSNQIEICDRDQTAGENGDAIYSYWKYYTTAWLPPQFTAGSMSELAFWNGDKTGILSTLYNSGSFVAVKTFCGMKTNWAGEGVVQKYTIAGITNGSTTTSTTPVVIDELGGFFIGSRTEMNSSIGLSINSAGSTIYTYCYLDGIIPTSGENALDVYVADTANYIRHTHPYYPPKNIFFGLHKAEARWAVSGNTGAMYNRFRNLKIEASA